MHISIIKITHSHIHTQGDVESIAQKSAKQLTTLFESISGSEEIIPEYEALKDAKEKAQQQHQLQQHKRKVSAEWNGINTVLIHLHTFRSFPIYA